MHECHVPLMKPIKYINCEGVLDWKVGEKVMYMYITSI